MLWLFVVIVIVVVVVVVVVVAINNYWWWWYGVDAVRILIVLAMVYYCRSL